MKKKKQKEKLLDSTTERAAAAAAVVSGGAFCRVFSVAASTHRSSSQKSTVRNSCAPRARAHHVYRGSGRPGALGR